MKKLMMLLLALALLPAALFAQVPGVGIKVGIGAGLSSGVGDGWKSVTEGAPTPSGVNVGIKAKLSLPVVPLTPVAHIAVSNLASKFTVLGTEYEFSQVLSTVGVGVEFAPIPLPIITPYIGADVSLNTLGQRKRKGGGQEISLSESASYFGVGIGAGAELNLPLFPIAFDLEAKYRLLNLVGKKDGEESLNIIQVTATAMFKF